VGLLYNKCLFTIYPSHNYVILKHLPIQFDFHNHPRSLVNTFSTMINTYRTQGRTGLVVRGNNEWKMNRAQVLFLTSFKKETYHPPTIYQCILNTYCIPCSHYSQDRSSTFASGTFFCLAARPRLSSWRFPLYSTRDLIESLNEVIANNNQNTLKGKRVSYTTKKKQLINVH